MADEGRKRKMQRKKGANLMKNLFKKIGALLVAAIMVLAMASTAFADGPTATITVNNADNATLTYAQVIRADQTTRTGWDFVNDDVKNAYIEAYGVADDDAQAAIEALIANTDAEKLGKAQALAAGKVHFVEMSNPQTVSEAGVYLVKATEEGYTYNIMSAYVGFGEVPNLTNATVDAKKTPIQVNKKVLDTDNVTKTGDILTYTVSTNVPYINPTDTDKSFYAYDELTGAEYVNTDQATITLNGEDVTASYPISFVNNKFSVDLSTMINDANSHAGEQVVITYQVKVTSENDTITNKATAGHEDGNEYGSKESKIYEGNITLTKYGENNVTLANAGFEVRKDGAADALTFVKLSDGVYKYVPADTEGAVTEVVTDANGKVKVQGLDIGTYKFKEVTAPQGYSVNTTDVSATLEVAEKDNGTASGVLTQTTSMKDTKLGALPSTGGMGTYLFTIIGVVVMAGAAGAFFMSRRKGSEE